MRPRPERQAILRAALVMPLLETNLLWTARPTRSFAVKRRLAGRSAYFRPHRTVRASRTCKSGLNNAARETNILLLGAAESLPLLNEEFAKSLFCGGKDSSAPTSSLLLPTLSVFFARRANFRDAGEAENRRLVTRGRRRTKRSFESGDDHASPIARQGDSASPAFP